MPQYEPNDSRLIPQELQRRPGPIPDDVRDKIKAIILEVLGQTQNVQAACEKSGITRATYNNWKNVGYITQEELDDTIEQYRDFLRGELQVRFMRGTRKPLMQNGRIVRDEREQPIWIDSPDNKLLMEVAKRWLPELQDTAKVESAVIVNSTIPVQYQIFFDARKLTREEFLLLKQVAQNVEDRETGIIVVEAGT